MEYSRYQEDIFREIKIGQGNLIIGAVAGSGKSTTIIEAVRRIPIHKKVIFLAFNTSIVQELKSKVPSRIHVSTLHSFGMNMCYKYYGRVFVNESKSFKFIKPVIEKARKQLEIDVDNLEDVLRIAAMKQFDAKKGRMQHIMIKLLDLFRMNMCVNLEDLRHINEHYALDASDDVISWTAQVIGRMRKYNRSSTDNIMSIDFTDMVYLPASVDEMIIDKYDYIFVDECQDLNAAQQQILLKMMSKHSRIIAVGDERQAIYGFAGSDAQSFGRLLEMPNTKHLPLSVCYRCGSSIVKHAQKVNPHIQPYEKAIEGEVIYDGSIDGIDDGDFVLCRNTKPLVELYFLLLSMNKKAFIKGRDIGENIAQLLDPYVHLDSVQGKAQLVEELARMREQLKLKGISRPEFNEKYIALKEKVDVATVLLERNYTVKDTIRSIKTIFAEDGGGITLSTIHKSKGLESDRVHIIRRDLIPSEHAVRDWQKIQELNLEYVMITRAKKQLIYIPNSNWCTPDSKIDFDELDHLHHQ